MVGSGVYILSEWGRKRFDVFPPLIADDGYVRSLFKRGERKTAPDCTFRIFAPRNVRELVKIKTRARFGNLELKIKYPGSNIGGENSWGVLAKLVIRRPWMIADALVYLLIQWQTVRNANRRLAASDYCTWERDESSRA
jgi:hypothetical protein